MNPFFNEIKKNFGFGCMRLPMKGDEVDVEEFTKMVDTFIENGFNYFDTAHAMLMKKARLHFVNVLQADIPEKLIFLQISFHLIISINRRKSVHFLKVNLKPAELSTLIFILCMLRMREFTKSIKDFLLTKLLLS